jgi:hypothetical protein
MSIVLPFKPFTLDEVTAITGVNAAVLDHWTLTAITPRLGEDKVTVGLDYPQTFAVFVGNKWLHEGAPPAKATEVVKAMAACRPEYLEEELKAGRSFPALASTTGLAKNMFIEPPKTSLGKRLCLKAMLAEFKANVAKVFPQG